MNNDIVDRMQGYENWQRREAAGLRAHYSKSPAMPELAEMHEETADALRDAKVEIERLREALRLMLEAADNVLTGLARGECEQWLYQQFAPIVGKLRVRLERRSDEL